MIAITIFGFVLVVFITRIVEFRLFMKKVSKLCNEYDWKHINQNPMCLLDKMEDENGYYLTSEWSAYNFLFLKGPSPIKIYLSFKPLTLENVYDKEVLEKLKKYEIK